eukprot:5294337-Amphidinium_carterae.4
MYLLAWRSAMPHILGNSDYDGHTLSNTYYRRAEDVSIEFNPLYNDQTPRDIEIRQLLGTIGTWCIDNSSRPDNQGNDTPWLDHPISTWMTTSTHYGI